MVMTKDDEMYGLICEKRFDRIDDQQKEVLELLKGKNGHPGLLDDMRQIKNRWKIVVAIMIFLSSALVLQAIQWLTGKL